MKSLDSICHVEIVETYRGIDILTDKPNVSLKIRFLDGPLEGRTIEYGYLVESLNKENQ